jgi:predicted nuclease of predicted toxin-antitoxin system
VSPAPPALRVKLDENLGRSHADLLRRAGYEADRLTDQGLSGAPDAAVWAHVCAEGRFLVTLDLDFSDVRRFPPGTHPGVLLLRPRSGGRQAVLDILARVLRERPLEGLRGCLAVAGPTHTRIRRPPPTPSAAPP